MKTILVIEDYTGLREDMVNVLQMQNYHVLDTDNCSDAITLLQQHQIDLVLSDDVLPDASGVDVLAYIRQHHCVRTLPFVLYSGYNTQRFQTAADFQPNLLLQKPMLPSALLAAIVSLLECTEG